MDDEKREIISGVLQELGKQIEREKTSFVSDADFNYGLDIALGKVIETALTLYEPIVSDVCLRFCKGEKVGETELSRLLDGLLGFCFDSRMVELYRKLCKAAYPFYKGIVTDYIHYFKEQWDSGET